MTDDYVSDNEALYRNVRGDPTKDEFHVDEHTRQLKITSQAFLDRDKQKPSVDRAKLRNYNPEASRLAGSGIVMIIARDVRHIGSVKTERKDSPTINHDVDVMPDPKPANDAHALIVVHPEFLSDLKKREKAFKLLRKALARLATESGWTLEPDYP